MDETMRDRDLPQMMKPADAVGSFIDEVGRRYGRLTVIERSGTKRREATWKCLCECGAQTIATGHALRRGKKRSCGCGWRLATLRADLGRESRAAINHKEGNTKCTPTIGAGITIASSLNS
jgi:hypothetical protein